MPDIDDILSLNGILVLIGVVVGFLVVRWLLIWILDAIKEHPAFVEYRFEKKVSKLVDEGKFKEAATEYMSAGKIDKATTFYMRGGQVREVARILENQGRQAEAAEHYERVGDLEKAGMLYAEAGELQRAERVLMAVSKPLVVAELYEKKGHLLKAAELYDNTRFYTKAGDCYERGGEALKGAICLQKASLTHVKRELGTGVGEFDEEGLRLAQRSAALFQKVGKHPESAEMFQRCGMHDRAAEAYAAAGMFEKAAEVYDRAGRGEDAAKLFEQMGQTRRAAGIRAELARKEGRRQDAAKLYEDAGDWSRAAEEYRSLGQLTHAADLFEKHGDVNMAAELYGSAGDFGAAAAALEKGGELERALRLHRQVNCMEGVARVAEKMERFVEAAEAHAQLNNEEEYIRLLQAVPTGHTDRRRACTLLGKLFIERGMPSVARQCLAEAMEGQGVRLDNIDTQYFLALASEHLKEFQKAKEIYERITSLRFDYKDVTTRLKELSASQDDAPPPPRQSSEPPAAVVAALPTLGKDRYEIQETIGHGSTGQVYRALDRVLARTVALKCIDLRESSIPLSPTSFLREAQIIAGLDHENIVRIFEVARSDGNLVLVLEYVEGKSLKDELLGAGRLPWRRAAKIGAQVAKALDFAHGKQLVHQDVKPSNILLGPGDKVKITDFGLARRLVDRSGSSMTVCGTPYYMSPEQVLGKSVDYRTDLYSLGATLFEMMVGHPPFTDPNLFEQHLSTPAPSPRDSVPEVPDEIDSAIRRCMAKVMADRPASARVVAEVLERLAST